MTGCSYDTLILLTDDRVRIRLKDEQAPRVLHLREALQRLDDPQQLPVTTGDVTHLYGMISEAMSITRPASPIKNIGLYEVTQKVDQDDRFTIFLADHRYIQTQPKTLLKVYHFDVYATEEEKQYRIREIFHGQDAVRLLGSHPNLLHTGDMFAWNDDSFVEPVQYLENGRRLEILMDTDLAETMTWDEKLRIIKGAARGLAYAHRKGVIHRDVRPMNIVVSPDQVKLANFDLAFIPNAPNLSIEKSVREHFDRRYVDPAVWLKPTRYRPGFRYLFTGIGLLPVDYRTAAAPRCRSCIGRRGDRHRYWSAKR